MNKNQFIKLWLSATRAWDVTPATPTVTINSNTSLTVDWVITGLDKTVTAVELWHSTDGTTYTRLVKLGAVATYDHDGLENNSIHYYKVRYWSGISVSGFSGVVVGVTMAPDFYSTERSGLSLVDSISSKNATILPATAEFNSTATTQSLQLASTINFTEGEINIKFLQPTYGTAAGGFLSNGGSGTNFILYRAANTIRTRFNGATKDWTLNNISTTAFNTLKVVSRLDTTTKVRVYCNGIEATQGEQDLETVASFTFNWIGYYHKMYMPYLSVINNGVNVLEMYPIGIGGIMEYNIGDNNNNATWNKTPGTKYLAGGTTYYLDNGFKIYEKPETSVTNALQYVPYSIEPTYITDTLEYVLQESFGGSSTGHNLTPSLIEFVGAIWDRSDTDIWSDDARLGYYDESNPKRWHSSELNQSNFNAWINASYKNSVFTKYYDNTIDKGRRLLEVFSFASPVTDDFANNIYLYTGLKLSARLFTASFDVPTISGSLSWDELSGYDYEIWRSVYGRTATLITTVEAGNTTYSDTTCKQRAWVNYWIKPIKNGVYGAITKATIIQTPWCFKTDQSTLQTITIPDFTLVGPSGKVTIDWGDGDSFTTSGQYNPTTKDYATEGQYDISLSGDLTKIIGFDLYDQAWIYGDITNWVFPVNFYGLHMQQTGLTGDVTDHYNWFLPTLRRYDATDLQITGDVSNWIFKEKTPEMRDLHFTNTLVTGDISNWRFSTETIERGKITLKNTLLTGNLTEWVIPEGMIWFSIGGSNFSIDMSRFHVPSTCSLFLINDDNNHTNEIIGDITGLNIFPTIESEYGFNLRLTYGELCGSMSDCIIPSGLTIPANLYFRDNNIIGLPRGAFDMVSVFSFANNLCDSAEIDSFLGYVDNYFTGAVVPLTNAAYTLNGTGMGIPSAAGLASRTSILGKYTAEGKTCTISVNS